MHGSRQLGQILLLQDIPHSFPNGPLPRPRRVPLVVRFRHCGHGVPGFRVQFESLLLALFERNYGVIQPLLGAGPET